MHLRYREDALSVRKLGGSREAEVDVQNSESKSFQENDEKARSSRISRCGQQAFQRKNENKVRNK